VRGSAAFIYAFALGWYVRASGLDEDIMKMLRDSYDLTVLHTAGVLRKAALENSGQSDRESEVAA
jgi:hypothetical protein